MSNEAISQPERRTRTKPKPPAEELTQQLKLLSDLTRLQLATILTKVFEELTRREADEIFRRSHEVLELTQAADIAHGWSREKPDVWY
jgi:hypothetical protein